MGKLLGFLYLDILFFMVCLCVLSINFNVIFFLILVSFVICDGCGVFPGIFNDKILF